MAGNSSRDLLLRAGERLFAREGIHRVRLREINLLAGQRNPSAVHYHFGSRDGLVEAILARHEPAMDTVLGGELDRFGAGAPASVDDIVGAAVHALSAQLASESGRDYLRIISQLIPMLSANLRKGSVYPTSPQGRRALELLERQLRSIPEAIRRERLVSYVLMLVGLLADRAHEIERGRPLPLGTDAFESNLVDMLAGALRAPVSAPGRSQADLVACGAAPGDDWPTPGRG